jgi:hypothetical protein
VVVAQARETPEVAVLAAYFKEVFLLLRVLPLL